MSIPIDFDTAEKEETFESENMKILKFAYDGNNSLVMYITPNYVYHEIVDNVNMAGYEMKAFFGQLVKLIDKDLVYRSATIADGHQGQRLIYYREGNANVTNMEKTNFNQKQGFMIFFGEGQFSVSFSTEEVVDLRERRKSRSSGGNGNGKKTGRKRKPEREDDPNEPVEKKQKV